MRSAASRPPSRRTWAVLLYWLKDPRTARAAASILLHPPAGAVDPQVDVVMTTSTEATFAKMFGDPTTDPRTPDLVVKSKHGAIYSLSKKKDEEHGGFADDDSHVGLVVSGEGAPGARASWSAAPMLRGAADHVRGRPGTHDTQVHARRRRTPATRANQRPPGFSCNRSGIGDMRRRQEYCPYE